MLRNTKIASVILAGLLVGCAQDPDPAPDLKAGKAAYNTACAICHGFEGEGLPGLGSTLVGNPFVLETTEAEFLDLVKNGRSATDPNNLSRRDMPPRGGHPELTDADLKNITAFVRSCLNGNNSDLACGPD